MLRQALPLVAVSLLAGLVPAQDPLPQPPRHLVVVDVAGAEELRELLALDLDLAACGPPAAGTERVEVVAGEGDLARLHEAGLEHTVAIRDLRAHYERELVRAARLEPPTLPAGQSSTLSPPLGQGSMGGHYTLAEMVAILDAFRSAFPSLCSPRTSIGKSVEGRDLWMVKISDNVAVDENEPEVLYDALHHAREPLSMETTLLFMDRLLNGYGSDPEATYLVDERELFFVPCVNPDGYEYNRRNSPGGGGLWRKNRRGGYGVDLNRNYATGFGGSGSSGRRSSETYRGPSAFSEPETAALEALASQRRFVQVFSTHTYTDVLLRPWGYRSGNPANVVDYDRVGRIATAENRIAHGNAYSLLYPAAGTALDHHHAAHGSLGWTAELGRSNEGGFWPNPRNTVNIATRHQPMFRAIALLSGPKLADGELILVGDGRIGSRLDIGMLGQAGASGIAAVSPGTANRTIPGVINSLRLDPGGLVALPPLRFPGSGYTLWDLTIPPDPGLRGTTLWWQMLHLGEPGPLLGDPQSLTLR